MRTGPESAPSAATTLARIPDWVWLVGFCVVFSAQVLWSVGQGSATFDEPSDLVSGYVELTEANYWLKPETLPLVKLVGALPLLLLPVRRPATDWRDTWNFYDQFLYGANDADTLLMVARAAVLPLSLLLGGLVFLWTRRLFGRGAALFALFLYAFEPNIVAHSSLVTTDLGIACFFFLTVYGLFRLTERASASRLLVVVFAFALALVTKLSMAMLIPIMVLLGLITSLSRVEIPLRIGGPRGRTLSGRGRKLIALGLLLVVASLVAYGVIWATYQFGYRGAESVGPRRPPEWAGLAPAGTPLGRALGWLRQTKALPEPYIYNFFYHLRTSGLFPAFLCGEIRQGGWWYFFVVTLLVKTPLALLVLLGLALAVHGKQWRKATLATAFLLVSAGAYFVFISASGFNIGHRHVLAVLPFLMVLAGALIPWASQQHAWVKGGLVALSLWYLGSSLSVFPHYLAYFNELAGGPSNGYRYLVDSNLDWGQDLKGLKRYMDQHGIERVWLSYFGMASPDYYGMVYDPLPGSTIVGRQHVRPDLLGLEQLPRLPGTVAISATNLQGVYLPLLGVNREYFAGYRNARPVARIGYSIFVYRFD